MAPVPVSGWAAQSAGGVAESMRTTPYRRMPTSRRSRAIRQPFSTCFRKALRPAPGSIADPPPVASQIGATTLPTTRFR